MKVMKTLWTKRWFQITLAVIVTGVLTSIFMNESIVKRTQKESSLREQELTAKLTETLDKLTTAERELSTHSESETERTTLPDGTVIEKIVVVTDTKLVEKVREEEKRKAEELLASKESEWQEKFEKLSVHKNPKRLAIWVGTNLNPMRERTFAGGFQYKVWGPVTVGVFGTSRGMVGPTVGITF